MRIRTTASVITALAALTACTADQPTAYTVANRAQHNRAGSADLILTGATEQQARDALTQYAATIDGVDLYYLKVMPAKDATTYVCRARWYRNADAYQANTTDQTTPSSWPHLTVNCP
jgi:hypothetical protein